jgi:hypothetical protein
MAEEHLAARGRISGEGIVAIATDEAVELVRKLVTEACNIQRAVYKKRGGETAQKRARGATVKLLMLLTGEKLTDGQVERALDGMGLI